MSGFSALPHRSVATHKSGLLVTFMSSQQTESDSSQPPKNGIARELYLIGRDDPERVENLFEDGDSDD